MEQLIVCKTEDWRFAVRPISWAGIWDKNGLLASDCKSLAYFEGEQDANDYIAYRALGTVKELTRGAALVKVQDEGRLVELPCEVGDMVYLTARGLVEETKVRTFFIGHPSYNRGEPDPGIEMIRLTNFDVPLKTFGKTVFLTRAEAEGALSGGGGDG